MCGTHEIDLDLFAVVSPALGTELGPPHARPINLCRMNGNYTDMARREPSEIGL